MNGVYIVESFTNNYYLKNENDHLILFNKHSSFHILFLNLNEYFFESLINKKILGIDNKYNLKFYSKNKKMNIDKMIWNLIRINKSNYLIQNKFNKKYLEVKNFKIICYNEINNKQIDDKFIFNIYKLYEEGKMNKKNLNKIRKEAIDVVIKYIDLTDKTLNRIGIKQIYKDHDNEELKYSIRSILNYIPWIRKIYIVMPNNKIKFLKPLEEIEQKIKYIKDKDLLGYDSANIFAFTFNFYKLEKFGVSKNFIYMEDDFFIGKSLQKPDFFYFDKKTKTIIPYLLTRYFTKMNNSEIISEYNNYLKLKNTFHPHSKYGWRLSIFSTNKYFIERYNNTLINTLFTHNAIAENIDDLKEVIQEISHYQYINETLFSKERNILTLNQPHFLNIYQLNIKHKKVHSIKYKYIEMELINKEKLDSPLFVINTGGNHIPLNRQYKIQKKYMEKRFPFKTIYENKKNNYLKKKLINIFFIKIFKLFINLCFIRIFI